MSRQLTIRKTANNEKLLETVSKLKSRDELEELIEKEPSILTIDGRYDSTIIDYALGNIKLTGDDIQYLLGAGAVIKHPAILNKILITTHTLQELERIKGIVHILLENGVDPNGKLNDKIFLHDFLSKYSGHNIYDRDYIQKMNIYVDIIVDILQHGGDLSIPSSKYIHMHKSESINIYNLLLTSSLYTEIVYILISRDGSDVYLNKIIQQYPLITEQFLIKLCDIIIHNINRKHRDNKIAIFNEYTDKNIQCIDILLNNGGKITSNETIIGNLSHISGDILKEIFTKLNIKISINEEGDNRTLQFTTDNINDIIKTYNGNLLNILLEYININDYKNEFIGAYKDDKDRFPQFEVFIYSANITFGTEPSNRVFDVNTTEDDGFNIITYALAKGDLWLIELLIKGGVDLQEGLVLIDIFNVFKKDYAAILSIITNTDALDRVDINYTKGGTTLLSIVINSIDAANDFNYNYNNIYNIIKILLEKGIDVNIPCSYRGGINNALPYTHLCAFYNHEMYSTITFLNGIYLLNIVDLLLKNKLNINYDNNNSLIGEVVYILIHSYDNSEHFSVVFSILNYLLKTDKVDDNKVDILSELHNYKTTIQSLQNNPSNEKLIEFNIKILDTIIYLIDNDAMLNVNDYLNLFTAFGFLFLHFKNKDIITILDLFLNKLVDANINIDMLFNDIVSKYIDHSYNVDYYQHEYNGIMEEMEEMEEINNNDEISNLQQRLDDIQYSMGIEQEKMQDLMNIMNMLKQKGAKYRGDIDNLPEELKQFLELYTDLESINMSEQIANNAIPTHNVSMNSIEQKTVDLSSVPYNIDNRVLSALTGKVFKGFTREQLDKYNPVIEQYVHSYSLQEQFPKERLVSFCPVCLSIEDHENQTCMYMSHDCKLKSTTGYYNKRLYEECSKIKVWPDERVPHDINWCALCGRVCGNHVHTKLSKYGDIIEAYKVEDVIDGQAYDSNCIKSGGGNYPEKLKRYIAFRDKAYTLNKLVESGKEIKFTDAMDQISAAAWNGPSTVSDERVQKLINRIKQFKLIEAKYETERKSALNGLIHNAISANTSGKTAENIKKNIIDNFTYEERPLSANMAWNISSKRFPANPIVQENDGEVNIDNLLIPDVPNITPELMPIVHERIDEDKNIINMFGMATDLSSIDDYFIIQLNHKQRDGVVNNHADSMIGRVGFKSTIRTMLSDYDHRLGFCIVPGCTAFMHPDEVKVALGVDKTEDEFIQGIFNIAETINMNQDEAREYAAQEYDENKEIYYEYKMVFNKKIYDFVINGMPNKGGFSKTKKQRGSKKQKATRVKKLKKKIAA